jgi:hypothetical protein
LNCADVCTIGNYVDIFLKKQETLSPIIETIETYAATRENLNIRFKDYMVSQFETLSDDTRLQADDVVIIAIERLK